MGGDRGGAVFKDQHFVLLWVSSFTAGMVSLAFIVSHDLIFIERQQARLIATVSCPGRCGTTVLMSRA